MTVELGLRTPDELCPMKTIKLQGKGRRCEETCNKKRVRGVRRGVGKGREEYIKIKNITKKTNKVAIGRAPYADEAGSWTSCGPL